MTATLEASWKVWVVKVDGRGRIPLPEEVSRRLAIKPGDTLMITEENRGLRIALAQERTIGGED